MGDTKDAVIVVEFQNQITVGLLEQQKYQIRSIRNYLWNFLDSKKSDNFIWIYKWQEITNVW